VPALAAPDRPDFGDVISPTARAGFLTFVALYALDLGMNGSRVVLLVFAGVVVGIRSMGARLPDLLGAARATRIALAVSAIGLSERPPARWGLPAVRVPDAGSGVTPWCSRRRRRRSHR
jgi:hypothetical protein